MSANELLYSGRAGPTEASKSRRVRRFIVDSPPDAALFDESLPQLGTVYPGGNPNTPFPLILDRFDVEPVGNGTHTYVDCVYTNDRSGRLNPAPDITKQGFNSNGVDFQETVSEIPTIYRYLLKIPGSSTSEPDTPTVEVKTFKVAEVVATRQFQVSVSNLNAGEVEKIRARTGEIHRDGRGKWWRFKAGQFRQVEKTAWAGVYTWSCDMGTPYPEGLPELNGEEPPYAEIGTTGTIRWYIPPPGPNKMLDLDPGGISDHELYIRSPFHVITFALDELLRPEWTQFCPYRVVPNGWATLPGVVEW